MRGAMREGERIDVRRKLATGPPDHLTRRRFVGLMGAAGGLALGGGGIAAFLEACSSVTTSSSSSASQKMTMAVFQEPDTLDPSASGLITVGTISQCVFDHLIWRLPNQSSFLPGLASSWQVSSDAASYTFKLRQDVKFHDGTPLDANAVKFTFDH